MIPFDFNQKLLSRPYPQFISDIFWNNNLLLELVMMFILLLINFFKKL